MFFRSVFRKAVMPSIYMRAPASSSSSSSTGDKMKNITEQAKKVAHEAKEDLKEAKDTVGSKLKSKMEDVKNVMGEKYHNLKSALGTAPTGSTYTEHTNAGSYTPNEYANTKQTGPTSSVYNDTTSTENTVKRAQDVSTAASRVGAAKSFAKDWNEPNYSHAGKAAAAAVGGMKAKPEDHIPLDRMDTSHVGKWTDKISDKVGNVVEKVFNNAKDSTAKARHDTTKATLNQMDNMNRSGMDTTKIHPDFQGGGYTSSVQGVNVDNVGSGVPTDSKSQTMRMNSTGETGKVKDMWADFNEAHESPRPSDNLSSKDSYVRSANVNPHDYEGVNSMNETGGFGQANYVNVKTSHNSDSPYAWNVGDKKKSDQPSEASTMDSVDTDRLFNQVPSYEKDTSKISSTDTIDDKERVKSSEWEGMEKHHYNAYENLKGKDFPKAASGSARMFSSAAAPSAAAKSYEKSTCTMNNNKNPMASSNNWQEPYSEINMPKKDADFKAMKDDHKESQGSNDNQGKTASIDPDVKSWTNPEPPSKKDTIMGDQMMQDKHRQGYIPKDQKHI